MGDRLNREQTMESSNAAREFKDEFGDNTIAKVEAYIDGESVIDDNIQVTISDYDGWVNVNIMWEDVGLKKKVYNKLGLNGYYSSGFCKMTFDGETLEIETDNGVVKITG